MLHKLNHTSTVADLSRHVFENFQERGVELEMYKEGLQKQPLINMYIEIVENPAKLVTFL